MAGFQFVVICAAIAYAWRVLAVGDVTRNDLRRAVFAVLPSFCNPRDLISISKL